MRELVILPIFFRERFFTFRTPQMQYSFYQDVSDEDKAVCLFRSCLEEALLKV